MTRLKVRCLEEYSHLVHPAIWLALYIGVGSLQLEPMTNIASEVKTQSWPKKNLKQWKARVEEIIPEGLELLGQVSLTYQ
jgi:hypothetical protein